LIHIKNDLPQKAQSTPEGTASQCDNPDGENIMLVSGVVATASLVGLLVVLFAAGLGLAWIDKRFDDKREH